MSQPYLGEIKMFAGNFAPRGYAKCDGQLMSIAQNTALFSILGTTFGGNGQTTFGLPDFRGRVPIHQGQGPGLSSYAMGQMGGVESVILTQTQLPQHTHNVQVNSALGTAVAPGNTTVLAASTARDKVYSTASPNTTLAPQALGMAGGSQPHENMQPYQTVLFIIALQGIFPSRN
jgi:microcystin-dependent protein